MEQEKIERIDKYLLGEMSAKESKMFEEEMASDQVLAEHVDSQRSLISNLKKYDERQHYFKMLDSVRDELADENEMQLTTSVKKIKEAGSKIRDMRRFLAIAASFLVLISAYLFFSSREQVNYSDMVSTYFEFSNEKITENLESPGATGVLDDSSAIVLRQAAESYTDRNLETAEGLLLSFKTGNGSTNYFSVLTDFYLGQIYLAWEQYEDAVPLFETINELNDIPVSNAVNWYLALSYLGSDRSSDAKTLLSNLTEDSEFGLQAERLLDEIE